MTKNSHAKQAARTAAATSGRSFTHERRAAALASSLSGSSRSDDVAAGLLNSRLLVVRGLTGQGKTTFAHTIAKKHRENGKRVILLDQDGAEQGAFRAIGVEVSDLRSAAAGVDANAVYVIDDVTVSTAIPSDELRALLPQINATESSQLIIVEHGNAPVPAPVGFDVVVLHAEPSPGGKLVVLADVTVEGSTTHALPVALPDAAQLTAFRSLRLTRRSLRVGGERGLSFSLDDRFLHLTGPVGSGKTVLAFLLARDWVRAGGRVVVIGRSGYPWTYGEGFLSIGADIAEDSVPDHAAPETLYIVEADTWSRRDGASTAAYEAVGPLLREVHALPSSRVVFIECGDERSQPNIIDGFTHLGLVFAPRSDLTSFGTSIALQVTLPDRDPSALIPRRAMTADEEAGLHGKIAAPLPTQVANDTPFPLRLGANVEEEVELWDTLMLSIHGRADARRATLARTIANRWIMACGGSVTVIDQSSRSEWASMPVATILTEPAPISPEIGTLIVIEWDTLTGQAQWEWQRHVTTTLRLLRSTRSRLLLVSSTAPAPVAFTLHAGTAIDLGGADGEWMLASNTGSRPGLDPNRVRLYREGASSVLFLDTPAPLPRG